MTIAEQAAELRKQAQACRQAARVATTGGHLDSRLLVKLADRLELDANELEATQRDIERTLVSPQGRAC
jgi:hypothetical protein